MGGDPIKIGRFILPELRREFYGQGEASGPRWGNRSHGLCQHMQLYSTLTCTSDAHEGPFATHYASSYPKFIDVCRHAVDKIPVVVNLPSQGPNFYGDSMSFHFNFRIIVNLQLYE